jgi:hypothetical protein
VQWLRNLERADPLIGRKAKLAGCPEKLGSLRTLDIEPIRQTPHRGLARCRGHSPLQVADPSLANAGALGKLLLGQSGGNAVPPQQGPE